MFKVGEWTVKRDDIFKVLYVTKSNQWITSNGHVQSITIDLKIKLIFFVDYSYDHLLIAF